MDAPNGWVPAFPGQRPPFQPGHQYSVGNRGPQTHGAYSARLVDPLAKQIAAYYKKIPGLEYLDTPRFAQRLWAYSRAYAQYRLVEEWAEGKSWDEVTTPRPGGKTSTLELIGELETRIDTTARRLGLFPIVDPDIQADIDASRKTLARRAERSQLKADLHDAVGEQMRKEGPEWMAPWAGMLNDLYDQGRGDK